MQAYACRVTKPNLRAIASEVGPRKWDEERAVMWLQEHGEGWFLRDEASVFDCQFIMPEVFFELYVFVDNDADALFRRVVKI